MEQHLTKLNSVKKRIVSQAVTENVKAFVTMFLFFCTMLLVISITTINVSAKDKTESITGKLYEFEKNSKYIFSSATSSKVTTSDFGSLNIVGNMKSISDVDGVTAYEVSDGNVVIEYDLGNMYTEDSRDSWYLVDDKSKNVDTEILEDKIMKGAIIIQTSLDGNSWETEKVLTNVAADSEYKSNIYTSKDVQQMKGCFYRIIVAYSLEKEAGRFDYLFVRVDAKEYMKCAEVYQFYLINSSENNTSGTSDTDCCKRNCLRDILWIWNIMKQN